jgi:branched-chain amino acid transport system substrate-binding protein
VGGSERTFGLLAALLLAGCSLGGVGREACTDDRQCRSAFGFGSTCGDDGLCRRAEPNPRCTEAFPDDLLDAPEFHADTLVIGNLMDRSLETQQARERAARLAFTQANDSGGIEGRALGVVFCTVEENEALDSLSRQEAAVASAEYLVEELGVPAIVGPSASSDTQAVFEALRDTGTLIVSPAATSPALTDIDVTSPSDAAPGLLWRTAPPDSLQGAAIAADMERRAVGDVAVIHAAGAYGEGLARELRRAFSGEVTLFPFDDTTARDEAVAEAGAGAFEEVLFISSQTADAVSFLNASALLSAYDGKGIFLTDAAANADFLDGTRTNASERYPQIRGTRPAVPSGFVYDLFAGAYGAAYSGEDVSRFSFTAHAYDAAWMVIYGLAWATLQEDEIRGETIARGLRQLSAGPALEVRPADFQPLVQAFRQGESVDIAGASGSLDYDPATEETRGPIDVWTISADGSSIVVEDTVEP